MNKNILAIAIAAAVAAPSAFAAATVYGVAHMSGNSFSSINDGAGNSTGLTSMSSNSSRLGIKGDEDLGGGLKAIYQMEFGVALDGNTDATTGTVSSTGTAGTTNSATTFTSQRNTFVGLTGGFGTVLAGRRDSLIKDAGRKYDLFGDQLGNNRQVLGLGSSTYSGLVDGRHNNVLAYVSPSFSGVTLGVAYVPGAGNTVEQYDNAAVKNDAVTAMVDYTAGAFSATAGYINVNNVLKDSSATANSGFTAYRLGAGYTFGAAKVVAIYQNANVNNVATANGSKQSQDAYGLGASYKVTTAGTVKAQYMMAANVSGTSNGADMLSVGYDHALSKNTTAYAAYVNVDNHGDTSTANSGAYTASMANGGAGSNVTAIAGKDNSAFSVGIIHNF